MKLQNIPVHHNELHLREAPGGGVHSLRDERGRDAQAAPLLLRGLLHLPVRRQHTLPALRLLLPPAGERLLLPGRRRAAAAAQAAQAAQGAQGQEQEEGEEGQGQGQGDQEQEGVPGAFLFSLFFMEDVGVCLFEGGLVEGNRTARQNFFFFFSNFL